MAADAERRPGVAMIRAVSFSALKMVEAEETDILRSLVGISSVGAREETLAVI